MFLYWLAMVILHPRKYRRYMRRYREQEAWLIRLSETIAEERNFELPLPVDGNAITCGNRTDLPKKQRRHIPVDMGNDFKNKGEKGIVEVPVTACTRCGRDDR